MASVSHHGQSTARLDVKQIVSTIVAGVFAVGIVFLVGIHVGKQVDAEAVVGATVEAPSAGVVAPTPPPEEPNQDNEYGFFELLEAPAPTRALAPVELAINPKLEEKRRAKKERRARKRKKANEEVALVKAPKKKKSSKKKARKSKKRTDDATQKRAEAPANNAPPVAVAIAETPDAGDGGSTEAVKEVSAEGADAVLAAVESSADAETKKERREKKAEKKTKKRYTVQVSAFQDEAVAKSLAGDLKSRGYKVKVNSTNVKDRGRWYRVRVGTFSSREDAEKMQSKLKRREGYAGFVTTL